MEDVLRSLKEKEMRKIGLDEGGYEVDELKKKEWMMKMVIIVKENRYQLLICF